jgi:hypothetical protein
LLSSETPLSEESVFCFRRHIFTRDENNTPVFERKKKQILEEKNANSAALFIFVLLLF